MTSISGSPIQYQSRNHSSVVSAHIILDVAKSSLVFLDTMVFWEGGVKQLHLGDFIFVVDYHVADVTLTSRRLRFVCVCFYVVATVLLSYRNGLSVDIIIYIHNHTYITNLFIDSSNLRDNTLDNHMCSYIYIYIYICIIIYIYIRNYIYIYTGARTCFTRFDQNHRKELKNTSG